MTGDYAPQYSLYTTLSVHNTCTIIPQLILPSNNSLSLCLTQGLLYFELTECYHTRPSIRYASQWSEASHSADTAVHFHDSGLASARSCARIQLDPMLAGCTMTVHVCGPIGNGRGSEARLVARFHTLIIRLPTPYGLFGSSNNTVRLSTRPV